MKEMKDIVDPFFFIRCRAQRLSKFKKAYRIKQSLLLVVEELGNVVGVLLATAGIEEFILVDSDKIELSNLSRQIMFREVDCDQHKTTVLSDALKDRASQIKITEFKEFIDESNIQHLKDADFILISGDQENVLDLINTFAVEHNIPFMNVGYVEDIAVWGPLVIPRQTGCYQCKQHLVNFEDLTQDQVHKCREINSGYQAPSTGPINMMASSFAALDILKFLGNFGQIQSLNTRIGIWSHDLHIEKQDYSINPLCDICGSLQKVN